jgi:ribA/ribD-fused uncharacterized protein
MKIESFSDDFRFLSNFHPSPLTLQKIVYPTVENAYQAMKSEDYDVRKHISTLTPGEAKKFGRTFKIVDYWEYEIQGVPYKEDVMYRLVLMKFTDPTLREALAATKGFELIEGNYWGDTFWGVCKGVGENRLGKILMRIRDNNA